MSEDRSILILSAMRALLGHVSSTLRTALIQKDGTVIRWRCCFDAAVGEDDFELVSLAGAEIIADFPACELKEEFEIVPVPQKTKDLNNLVFSRFEGDC